MATTPLVTDQTCRSCTARHPRHREHPGPDLLEGQVARDRPPAGCRCFPGAAARRRPGSAATGAMERIGSARVQPVKRMMTAAPSAAGRAEGVAEDVEIGAAGVERAVVVAVQQPDRNEVHDQAHRGHDHEDAGLDRFRVRDALRSPRPPPRPRARTASRRSPARPGSPSGGTRRSWDRRPAAAGHAVNRVRPSAPTSVSMCPASASRAAAPRSASRRCPRRP